MTRVAFLGLGRMGEPMARRLAAWEADVTLWNRTRRTADELGADTGASVSATPAEAAADANIIITMLADERAGHEVYLGPQGILSGLHEGAVTIEMTTTSPSWARQIASRVTERAAASLDAPVSGSVAAASAGTLTILVGGEGGVLERVRPLLEILGSKVFHMGPVGAGATMKLVVNSIVFALNEAVAESLVLAERAGIDRVGAYDVLANSAIAAPLIQYKRDAYLRPNETPPAFALELAGKDLDLALALADEVGAVMPQATLDLERIRAAARRFPGRDFSYVAEHLREIAAHPGPGTHGRAA